MHTNCICFAAWLLFIFIKCIFICFIEKMLKFQLFITGISQLTPQWQLWQKVIFGPRFRASKMSVRAPWSCSGAWTSTAHTFKCWTDLGGLYCKTRNVRFSSNRLEKTTTFAHSFLNALSVYFLNVFLAVVCFVLIKGRQALNLSSPLWVTAIISHKASQ